MNKIENYVPIEKESEPIGEILIDLKRDVGSEIVGEIAERIRVDLGLEKHQICWSNDCFAIVNFEGNFDELMKYLTNVFSGQNVVVEAKELNFEAIIG